MGVKSLVYGVGINDMPSGIIKTKEYVMWQKMIGRCFDIGVKTKQPSYLDVTCCDDWVVLSKFLSDIKSIENFDRIYDDVAWEFDKDLLVKGNKIYSFEKCCFVPPEINKILVTRKSERGSYPLGVSKIKGTNKYRSQISINGKNKHLGRFSCKDDAFNAYRNEKLNLICILANKWKSDISNDVYNALINRDIDIND